MMTQAPLIRLVRCQGTGRYLAAGDPAANAWIADPDRATNFPTSAAAIDRCLRGRLSNVELVLRVAGLNQDAFRASIP